MKGKKIKYNTHIKKETQHKNKIKRQQIKIKET